MPITLPPWLLLTLANLFWAGNWVVGRAVRELIPPLTLTFGRWLTAALLVLPFAWRHWRMDGARLIAGWREVLVLGLTGTAAYNAFTYIGLTTTTVLNGLLINACIPIAIVLLGWLWHKRSLCWHEGLGIIVSTAGVLWIIARGEWATLLGWQFHAGDLWILAAVLAWAIYTLRLSRRPKVHPLSFLAAIAWVGTLALAPWSAWELQHGAVFQPTPAAWAAILYTGLCAGLLGFVCWNQGVAALGAARAGLSIHLMPVFGFLLAALFLGEQPAWFHLVGVLLIFGGLLLASRRC